MPLCDVCHHDKRLDAPCCTCGFCGVFDGFVVNALLPSSSTLVNDARALAYIWVRNFIDHHEEDDGRWIDSVMVH